MRIFRLILMMFLALASAACGNDVTPATTVASAPATKTAGPRIISTGPALTLLTTQVGAGDLLVGVSSLDKELLPEGKQDLPVVGDYNTMNYELLAQLKPTALLLQKAEDRIEPQLRNYCDEHHVEMINARLDTVADIYATARQIAAAAGMSAAVEQQIAMSDLRIARLKQRVKDAPRPKVLYIVGTDPIFVVGGERFMNEMIEMAGGDNLGATIKQDFPDVTREMILELKPDVILVAAPGDMPQRANDPRLKTWLELPTPAAADGRVYLVTDPQGSLPSLAVAQSAQILAKLLHPEINFDSPLAVPATSGSKP